MRKVAFISDIFSNNACFSPMGGRDGYLKKFYHLKECFRKLGYELLTQDMVDQDQICFSIQLGNNYEVPKKWKNINKPKYLISLESYQYDPTLLEPEKVINYFEMIFCWDDKLSSLYKNIVNVRDAVIIRKKNFSKKKKKINLLYS